MTAVLAVPVAGGVLLAADRASVEAFQDGSLGHGTTTKLFAGPVVAVALAGAITSADNSLDLRVLAPTWVAAPGDFFDVVARVSRSLARAATSFQAEQHPAVPIPNLIEEPAITMVTVVGRVSGTVSVQVLWIGVDSPAVKVATFTRPVVIAPQTVQLDLELAVSALPERPADAIRALGDTFTTVAARSDGWVSANWHSVLVTPDLVGPVTPRHFLDRAHERRR